MRDGRCSTENANPSPTSLRFQWPRSAAESSCKITRFGIEAGDEARLSTNVDNHLINCGQVGCGAKKGCNGEVVHSTYSQVETKAELE